MITNVLWMKIIPGYRDSGIAKLKELAQMMKDDHGSDAGVVLQVNIGSPYLAGLVSRHENIASMAKTIEALRTSKNFAKWNENAVEDFEWPSIEWQTFRAFRPGGDTYPNFIHSTACQITPGNIDAGRALMGKMADYFEATYGSSVGLYHLDGGPVYRHFWIVSYDSLERYEEVSAALDQDPKWAELRSKMGDMFDYPTFETALGQYI